MSTSPGPEHGEGRPSARLGRAGGRRGPARRGIPDASGERRHSRERALELTYESEQKGLPMDAVLSELPVPPSDYALELVTGLAERIEEVDDLVSTYASGWAIERMPAVDRCILRLATYELVAQAGVPVAVVIDEAVELAKQYSTEDSPRFVNGVLAAIADVARPDVADAGGPARGDAGRRP